MAQILITVEYDGDDDPTDIAVTLDAIAGAIDEPVNFAVQVDGEHRDPDDPGTGLFS
jgi:hypothetical protein